MIMHVKCLLSCLAPSRPAVNYDSLPFPFRDLHQTSSVTPLPCWVQPDTLDQGLSQVEEGDHAQHFLQWSLSSQCQAWLREANGAKVVSPPTLGEREMGEGSALGLSIFSLLAIELYNHLVRSGLSFREVKKLTSSCTASE